MRERCVKGVKHFISRCVKGVKHFISISYSIYYEKHEPNKGHKK